MTTFRYFLLNKSVPGRRGDSDPTREHLTEWRHYRKLTSHICRERHVAAPTCTRGQLLKPMSYVIINRKMSIIHFAASVACMHYHIMPWRSFISFVDRFLLSVLQIFYTSFGYGTFSFYARSSRFLFFGFMGEASGLNGT